MARNVSLLRIRIVVTHLQIPRGPTSQEQGITGREGELRLDLSRMSILAHDGEKQGGYEIPNIETVKDLIARGGDNTAEAGALKFYTTEAAMIAAVPNTTTFAVVIEDGLEDIYRWHPGNGDAGDVPSGIDGYWKRISSDTAMITRLWRMGWINVQFDGSAPIANQDILLWLNTAGEVMLWDGANYVAATPTLWARLFAHIGGYSTETFILPDRLKDTLVEVADADLANESGWYKSAAAATNMPVAGVHTIVSFKLSATVARQTVLVQGSTTLTKYTRFKNTTWGSWVGVDDVLPDRLAATSGAVTDANSAVESGFYQINGTGSNIPTAEKGTLTVVRYSATAATQLWISTDSAKIYFRAMLASVWSAWTALDPTSMALLFLKLAGNQTVTGGFRLTPYSIGSVVSGTVTPDAHNHNYQYYTNNGAHTLAAPANDCAIDLLVTNGATAGAVTFSGFTVSGSIGDALTTTNTHKFVISIRRINSVATYMIKALQ